MSNIFNDPNFINELNKSQELPQVPTYESQSIFNNFDNQTQGPVKSTVAKKSMTQLANDPEFNKRAERFLNGIERNNENIFEFLRDSDYSLASAALRSFEVGNWSQQEKEDYNYLRQEFNNAELRGVRERLGFAKDLTIDMLGDPFNIAAALFAVPTGGSSIAATQAAKEGAKLATQSLVKRMISTATSKQAKESAAKTAKIVGLEGAAWGGSHDYFVQNIDVGTGLRDAVDFGQVGLSTVLGAGIGAGVGGILGGAIGARYYSNQISKYSNEDKIIKSNNSIEVVDEFVNSNKVNHEIQKTASDRGTAIFGSEFMTRILSTLAGEKSVTRLARTAETLKENKSLVKILELFRYDAFDKFVGKNVNKVRERVYGENRQNQSGKYFLQLEDAFANLKEEGIFNIRLNKLEETQLVGLIRNPKDQKLLKGTVKFDTQGNEILRVPAARKEVIEAADIIRNKILKPIWAEGNEAGIWGATQKVFNYFPRIFNRSKLTAPGNPEKLEKLLIKSGHADPIDQAQAVKNKEIFERNQKEIITSEGDTVKGIDVTEITTDENIFGVDFMKEAGGDITEARKAKAKRIVSDMINQDGDAMQTFAKNEKYSFMKSRVFSKLSDTELADFLEDDVRVILSDYITSTSEVITRARMKMRTFSEFETNYIKPLKAELESQNIDASTVDSIVKQARNLYTETTGVKRFQTLADTRLPDTTARTASEGIRVIQQMAHLGGATISSITEPLILLSRVPLKDAPAAVKDIAKGFGFFAKDVGLSMRRGFQRMEIKLPNGQVIKKAKATTKAEKKAIQDDFYREAYQTGLAMEQAIVERLEAMTGEALTGSKLKSVSRGFFKANFLEQWTRSVQLASFTTGKRLIRQNSEKLYKASKGTIKLNDDDAKYISEQLLELGIKPTEAVEWYSKSLDNGVFSEARSKAQDFYANKYLLGANRFTNEVILQPTASMANKPTLHNSAVGKLLFQFAGYPTVFTNTVLKRFANELTRNNLQATPRIVSAALLMTAGAGIMNHIRTKGAYADDSAAEQTVDAVRRWGGLGAGDYYVRIQDAMQGGKGNLHSIGMAPFGPVVQDVADVIGRRKGSGSLITENIPGYAVVDLIFGQGTKADLRSLGRDLDKKERELLEKVFQIEKEETGRPFFTTGGLVKGPKVQNTKEDPAEAINPQTGLTYEGKTPVEQQMDDMLEERTGLDN